MSIQFEYEKPGDIPRKCFGCPHMKALRKKEPRKYQCCYNTCKVDEDKKREEEEKKHE